MFSSLDRVDIVLTGEDGREEYVQTDHRSVVEIEQEPELSILFALIRILGPKLAKEPGEPDPVVLYATQVPPPEFLRRAIFAAGGQVAVARYDQRLVADYPAPPPEELANAAFAELSRRVVAEFHARAESYDGVRKVL